MCCAQENSSLGIAIIGAGTVGGGVLDMLRQQSALLRRRCGHLLEVTAVVKRDLEKIAHIQDYADRLTRDWRGAVEDPRTDIVVELMGGMQAADCIRAALAAGKPVVTANKALLAETSAGEQDILNAAAALNLPVAHEAAIAGCIPVVKTLRESLAGDSVHAIYGIINGTCNYILTAMESEHSSFADALAKAQALGYAESDPSFDIDGIDAAHKLLLMARMAFACLPTMKDISVIGIRDFDYRDIVYARQFNYRVKLLAVAKKIGEEVELRVRPAMLPLQHNMASVEGAMNAVAIRSRFCGETIYYGAGAGAHPTATAVVADIMEIARRFNKNGYHHVGNGFLSDDGETPPAVVKRMVVPYYLRLRVIDRPGVIANVTRLLAQREISIEAMHQNEVAPGCDVDIIILLHATGGEQVADSIADIEQLPTVTEPVVVIPIERLD